MSNAPTHPTTPPDQPGEPTPVEPQPFEPEPERTDVRAWPLG